jgi:hypothetical protein
LLIDLLKSIDNIDNQPRIKGIPYIILLIDFWRKPKDKVLKITGPKLKENPQYAFSRGIDKIKGYQDYCCQWHKYFLGHHLTNQN